MVCWPTRPNNDADVAGWRHLLESVARLVHRWLFISIDTCDHSGRWIGCSSHCGLLSRLPNLTNLCLCIPHDVPGRTTTTSVLAVFQHAIKLKRRTAAPRLAGGSRGFDRPHTPHGPMGSNTKTSWPDPDTTFCLRTATAQRLDLVLPPLDIVNRWSAISAPLPQALPG
jgi:hypothetical protein